MTKKCIIYIGTSGSGKDTHYRANYKGAPMYCTDTKFIVNGKYVFDINKLSNYHDDNLREFSHEVVVGTDLIVVNNTNTSMWEVSPYYRLAECYGYSIEFIHLKCHPSVAHARNIHGVPEGAIWAQYWRSQKLVIELQQLKAAMRKDWTITSVDTSPREENDE